MNESVERTGKNWNGMVLLLGLCSDSIARTIETVKGFLEKVRNVGCQ